MKTDIILVTQSGYCSRTCKLFDDYVKELGQEVERYSLDRLLRLFINEGRTKGIIFVCLTKKEYGMMNTALTTITDRYDDVDIVMIFSDDTDMDNLQIGRSRFLEITNEKQLTVEVIDHYVKCYTDKIGQIREPDYLVVKCNSKIRKIDKHDSIVIETTDRPHQLSLIGKRTL